MLELQNNIERILSTIVSLTPFSWEELHFIKFWLLYLIFCYNKHTEHLDSSFGVADCLLFKSICTKNVFVDCISLYL